ncbi:hypothetical protein A3768_3527 [Ralstonia solanacearum]|nr:hypothetical protein A3768_3527 [Ralstonia solanacearum]
MARHRKEESAFARPAGLRVGCGRRAIGGRCVGRRRAIGRGGRLAVCVGAVGRRLPATSRSAIRAFARGPAVLLPVLVDGLHRARRRGHAREVALDVAQGFVVRRRGGGRLGEG